MNNSPELDKNYFDEDTLISISKQLRKMIYASLTGIEYLRYLNAMNEEELELAKQLETHAYRLLAKVENLQDHNTDKEMELLYTSVADYRNDTTKLVISCLEDESNENITEEDDE